MKATHVTTVIAAGVVAVALFTGPGARSAVQATRPAPAAAARSLHYDMVVMMNVRLGPDRKLHDAFTPADITAPVGQKVTVIVYSYDTDAHSFTVPDWNLNVVIPGVKHEGVPTVTTFSFTARTPGTYHWLCLLPCDGDAKGWAMAHDTYMAGTVPVEQA